MPRKATRKTRIEIEATGVALCVAAVFLAIAMGSPLRHVGIVRYVVIPIHWLFGWIDIVTPISFGAVGMLCFYEFISEQGEILALCFAGFAYQALFAAYSSSGNVGKGLHYLIVHVFADLSTAFLLFLGIVLTQSVLKISLKEALYHGMTLYYRAKDSLDSLGMPIFHLTPKWSKALPQPVVDPTPMASTTAYPAVCQIPNEQPPADDYTDISEVSISTKPDREIPSVWAGNCEYTLPPMSLFDRPIPRVPDFEDGESLLVRTLNNFNIPVENVKVVRGASITRYELKLALGKAPRAKAIKNLSEELAMVLEAKTIRIEAPIPGKNAVGIEVPNKVVSPVVICEVLSAMSHSRMRLPIAIGQDITGKSVFVDLIEMPHLLIAGTTGAGKSVGLNGIIASLLSFLTPDQLQMILIDPKKVELEMYSGIPHLIKEIITDPRMAAGALFEMTKEMDSRYVRFSKMRVKNIDEYNEKCSENPIPFIVVVIDELGDLMMVAKDSVEKNLIRLLQLARACGIHVIVATQRPSHDVITGLIKANLGARISFRVASHTDSTVVLGFTGAEKLLGRGDMIANLTGWDSPQRLQGAYICTKEIDRLVSFWAKQARPKNLLDVEISPIEIEQAPTEDRDPLLYDAAEFIVGSRLASTAQLQSHFQVGHPRAVKLMKSLEEARVVGPHEGTKPRKILIGPEELELVAPHLGKKG